MNKNEIFKNYSLKTGTVEVPNWGGEVVIRELSASALESIRKANGSELEMAAIAVINGVLNEENKRMFNDTDKKKLLDMSASDLVLVSTAVIELSDLGEEGKE
jgi:hypothetical protein